MFNNKTNKNKTLQLLKLILDISRLERAENSSTKLIRKVNGWNIRWDKKNIKIYTVSHEKNCFKQAIKQVTSINVVSIYVVKFIVPSNFNLRSYNIYIAFFSNQLRHKSRGYCKFI